MPDGQMLEFSGLTKRFGSIEAVSGFTAQVGPGVVTGFLGPNGAGKTTTLRALLGLIKPDAGTATIGGVTYPHLSHPLQTVGAVLEASSFHPGRTAANHLKAYAQAAGLPLSRVDETLGLVGLADSADRKVGGFSLGMRQRLGLAYALLGDPGVLVLDEPSNGLDPEGIKWLRGFLREYARQGRTVLVSSHLLTEVQQTVDALLIIAHGRLVFQGGLDTLTDPSEFATVVDSPDRAALAAALGDAEVPFEILRSGLTVRGAEPAAVGLIAAANGVPLSALQRRGPALEEVFLDLVSGVRSHPSATSGPMPSPGAAGVAGIDGAAGADRAAGVDDLVGVDEYGAGAGVAAAVAIAVVADDDEDEDLVVEIDGADGEDVDPWDEADEDEADVVAVETVAATPADDATPTAEEAADETTDEPANADRGDDEPEAFTGHAAEPEGADDVVDSTPADVAAPYTEASFAVAGTGIIDIIPPSGAGAADDVAGEQADDAEAVTAPGEDSNPDVDALVEIDDELTDAELDDAPEGEASDRPWENYVKTEADVEADRFFGAFDSEGRAISPSTDPEGSEPGEAAVAQEAAEAATGPFGTLSDLSPDWEDGDDADPESAAHEEEEGDQR